MSSLQSLVESDAALVARFDRDRAAYLAARADAERASARHSKAVAALRDDVAALGRERKAKRVLLGSVRKDRSRERSLLVELEKAARALETAIASLGQQERKHGKWVDASEFGKLKGRLGLPVSAKISGRFGKVVDDEFQTETFRNGVEFAADAGEAVAATARGEVRFAGWFRGYGKIVILDHGDSWFTISGHLDDLRVEAGERVKEGAVIGTVGETGSLVGPSLYFELRKGSEPLNPKPWFSKKRLAELR